MGGARRPAARHRARAGRLRHPQRHALHARPARRLCRMGRRLVMGRRAAASCGGTAPVPSLPTGGPLGAAGAPLLQALRRQRAVRQLSAARLRRAGACHDCRFRRAVRLFPRRLLDRRPPPRRGLQRPGPPRVWAVPVHDSGRAAGLGCGSLPRRRPTVGLPRAPGRQDARAGHEARPRGQTRRRRRVRSRPRPNRQGEEAARDGSARGRPLCRRRDDSKAAPPLGRRGGGQAA
mmetsp:Transcript_40808/g.132162  ORF Transcript_40808/g.132162 Transcript_40808/m.132162 type:complete len:234 (-) Transcript_40808:146-847(-)